MTIKTILSKFGKPKFRSTRAVVPAPGHILDIGVANNSYLECKTVFPTSIYHGLDYQEINFTMVGGDRFILCDLESDGALGGMQAVYDLIIVNHVLEHLTQGHKVFTELLGLLRPGGVLYAEFPSIRTAYKRKVGNSYHFHDDPSHRSFYKLEDLANAAILSGCSLISCGPVSSPPFKSLVSLPRALYNFFMGRGFVRFLPKEMLKIDHIMVQKNKTVL